MSILLKAEDYAETVGRTIKLNAAAYQKDVAGGFADGREIISEVFANMSTGKPSEFSRRFYEKVLELTRAYDEKQ